MLASRLYSASQRMWACVLLVLPLQGTASPTALQFPGLVDTTIYSTNARVVLAPESSCSGSVVGQGCGKRYDPWDLETYADENGRLQTYHRTSSWGNQPLGDQIRSMLFGFRGAGLQVYGAPRRQLEQLGQLPGRTELCIQGICREIDTQELYDFVSEDSQDLPVLLWSADDLVEDNYHRLEIRLLDSAVGRDPVSALTIHHLVYQEREAMLPPSYEPSGQEELVHSTYYDTNPWVSYSPHTACHASPLGCVQYHPWERVMFALPAGHNQTFTHTSSWGNDPSGENIRTVSFLFQGVALYVYGASKIQTDRIHDGDSYEHAHQEICIDNDCHIIDAHQMYLNIDDRHAYEPVLLWSYDRFPSTALRHVQLRLLDKDSPVGHIRRMTFNRFVVSEIREIPSRRHPIPGAQYTHVRVDAKFASVTYSPDKDCIRSDCHHPYTPWEKQRYIVPGGQELSYYRTSTWDHKPNTHRRSWEVTFSGHTIKVYGAPRPYLVHTKHAMQEICLDGHCQPVDVERAYLRVEPDVEHHPVPIWSMDNIDVSGPHTLLMRMIESQGEAGDVIKGMTFSHLEYTEVILPPPVVPSLPPIFEAPEDMGMTDGLLAVVRVILGTIIVVVVFIGFLNSIPTSKLGSQPDKLLPTYVLPSSYKPERRPPPPLSPESPGAEESSPPPYSPSPESNRPGPSPAAGPPPPPQPPPPSPARASSSRPKRHEHRRVCDHWRCEQRADGTCITTHMRTEDVIRKTFRG